MNPITSVFSLPELCHLILEKIPLSFICNGILLTNTEYHKHTSKYLETNYTNPLSIKRKFTKVQRKKILARDLVHHLEHLKEHEFQDFGFLSKFGYSDDWIFCFGCFIASSVDALRALKFAMKFGCKLSIASVDIAAEKGNLRCLIELIENGCMMSRDTRRIAVSGGHECCVEYLDSLV
eukprot:TRINITY_DN3822_c0_g1_i1.p1 TRINITY_DN3822_c0_g1~~TRINITY_DN3822_c0_g1_i1.p1  ORF type:complete len:179 (+),score=36.48 TRINITY_DN3822_c0_g1_i1:640-1176(+)